MEDPKKLRKIISLNIKRQREKLGISQEKLAEDAEISANMMNDIEGCRTWISDKTLVRLAKALDLDEFQLLIPSAFSKEELVSAVYAGMAQDLMKLKKGLDSDIDKLIKRWGIV